MRKVNYYVPVEPLRSSLQKLANKLAKAKAQVGRAEIKMQHGERRVDAVRTEFYTLADAMFGEDTYIIYESDEPNAFHRMCREIQEPREFDVEALRRNLPPEQFAAITKTVVDVKALDSAEGRHEVDSAIVAEHTNYTRRPNLIWAATGSRAEIKLRPGQIAVVGSQHIKQEK